MLARSQRAARSRYRRARMAKQERIVLVDGSWLVFRAFFALPSNLKTNAGLHTNAIFGFATMFRKLFSGRAPDRGAVVFDAPGGTHRDEKFPAYKAQRPPIAGELREQLPWIDELVATQHFPLLRVPGWEADDVIGTLARRALAEGMEVIVVAGDKDIAQLVGEGLRMQDTMRDVTYDAELVRKKWGVAPAQIPDLLALMGDTVDNIPGVPGIGQKGAAQLVTEHGSIEGILANLGALKGKKREALEANADAVRLYRELATIATDVPLDVTLDDLRITPPDAAELDALYRKLEFYSLLSGGDAQKATDATHTETRLVASAAELDAWIAALPANAPVVVAPIFEPIARLAHARVVGVALAAELGAPIYAPMSDALTLAALAPLLADAARPKVAHDIKELAILVAPHGVALAGPLFDTMLASFLVEPVKCIPHRLDQVAKEYVQRPVPPLKGLLGGGQKERAPSEVPIAELAAHAGEHADVILELAPVLRARLDECGLADHYARVELPLAFVLADMERAGIRVDRDDLVTLGGELRARKAAIEARIYELAGHEFNIGSTKQLATVLFEELSLPVIKKNKTGYSTDAEVLERLAPKHDIAREILSQRELAKLINTYTDVLAEAIAPETGRVHAHFQQTVGVSGRLISTDPDLQRTPVRTPEGKRIRQAFVAPAGTRIVAADWSQIELRVLAHFSGDAHLREAFRDRLDLHRRTASILFGVAESDITPEQRGVGKTVNFATIYGQGATALGQILGISRKDAVRYIEQYFEHYAGVRAWLDRTIADAHEKGYVTTILGRRRYIAELSSLNQTDRAFGERVAANTPIQGSAADLCTLAMLAIARELPSRAPRTRMLLQVHDELVFESPEDEVDAATDVIRRAMESPHPLDVPLEVGIGVGASWGDAKE